jgi:hypothetical protein
VIESSIRGIITDTSGAIIPGVKIEVTKSGTGEVRSAETSQYGTYTVPSLTLGTYQLKASAGGFQTRVITDIVLRMNQQAQINVTLDVGAVQETVTVEANAVILDTERTEVAQVVAEKLITDLPLNGRNFLQLAAISNGVVTSFGRGSTEADSFSGGRKDTTMHVGARGDALSFLIDGVEARFNTRGFLALPPSVDAIEEFKVQRNSFSAEYGFGAAIISATIKSGTNQIHGTAFEFLRNDNVDARNFFETGKNEFRQNQFGVSMGGPLIKDKTFLFGDYEGLRVRQELTFIASVPPEAFRRGDFSALSTPLTDPFAGGEPFSNNTIPTTRISNFAGQMNKYIPAANTNLQATAGLNINTTDNFVRDFDQYTIRLDHRFSDADTFSARYIQHDDDQLTPQSHVKGTRFTSPINSKNGLLQYTRVFSPTIVNVFRVARTWSFVDTVNEACEPACDQFGFRNFGLPEGKTWLPSTSILPYTGFGGVGYGFGETENLWQVSDTFSKVAGKHNISLGFDFRRSTARGVTFESTSGSLSFQGDFTGQGMGDYLLGIPREFSTTAGTNYSTFRFPGYAYFFQDDIKLTPTLTINLGVRYEYRPPSYEISGSVQQFDWDRGVLKIGLPFSAFGLDTPEPPWIEPGATNPIDIADKNNWGPRFGIAWQPFGENTVFRMGYGIFYIVQQYQETDNKLHQEPPIRIPVAIASDPTTPEILIDRGDLIPPPGDLLQTAQLDLQAVGVPEDRTPYMQQWSFGIQHRLNDYLFEATYAGSAGRKLGLRLNQNSAIPSPLPDAQSRRPYPNFAGLLGRFNSVSSSYNSLILKVEKRFSGDFSVLASHTYSHALDIESREPSATVVQDPRNLNLNHGNSAYDVRHRFVASAVYELPFGKGKSFGSSASGAAGKLISGWQVNSIVVLSAGNWFSPRVRVDRANEGPGFRWQRPDVLRDPNISGGGTVEEWFDTSAIVLQPFGQYGNMGRNTLRAPGITQWDFSLFKNTLIAEHLNVQFRMEFFNFMNHPNFRVPNSTPEQAGFGVITSAEEPRRIQFGLKLIW